MRKCVTKERFFFEGQIIMPRTWKMASQINIGFCYAFPR